MTVGDKSAGHAVEGMIERVGLGATITVLRETRRGDAITEQETIAQFLSRKDGAFKKAWVDGKPSACLRTAVKAFL